MFDLMTLAGRLSRGRECGVDAICGCNGRDPTSAELIS